MIDGQQATIHAKTEYVLATRYAQGTMAGRAAASADTPDFVSYHDVLQEAWDASCARAGVPSLAQQVEYFIGWARGYMRRVDEVEDVADTAAPDIWEDDGGALPAHLRDSRATPANAEPESTEKEATDSVSSGESAR